MGGHKAKTCDALQESTGIFKEGSLASKILGKEKIKISRVRIFASFGTNDTSRLKRKVTQSHEMGCEALTEKRKKPW